jgi:hypothetical protein
LELSKGKEEGKKIWMELLPVGKEKGRRRQDKEEERRRTDELSQRLMRKIRELQGPVCKAKFSIDLKP